MRLPFFQTLLSVLLLAAVALPVAAGSSQPADTIVVNAHIYTVNPQQVWAEAIAIRGGKIGARR